MIQHTTEMTANTIHMHTAPQYTGSIRVTLTAVSPATLNDPPRWKADVHVQIDLPMDGSVHIPQTRLDEMEQELTSRIVGFVKVLSEMRMIQGLIPFTSAQMAERVRYNISCEAAQTYKALLPATIASYMPTVTWNDTH
jgi:hypothetical protein